MKIQELKVLLREYGGWTVREGSEWVGRVRVVYIASKRMPNNTQVRLRNFNAAALRDSIAALERGA